MLASAVLQVQHLPENVVSPFAAKISNIICRGLRSDFGCEGKKGAIWECLGALQTIADSAYAAFNPYLPSITPFLLAIFSLPSSVVLKFKAALAFGSAARLCVENDLPLLRKTILQSLHTFVLMPSRGALDLILTNQQVQRRFRRHGPSSR
jgi:hypothetical protein